MVFIAAFTTSLLLFFVRYANADGEALVITRDNYADTLKNNKLVLINFYADWCHFSGMLAPIYAQAASLVHEEFPNVKLGKLDCEDFQDIAMENSVSKYPTIKIYRNGKVMKKEYRGQRAPESFHEFVKEQMKPELNEYHNAEDFQPDTKRPTVIGYFEQKDSENYRVFESLADDLREQCQFWVGLGDASAKEREDGRESVVFRPGEHLGDGGEARYDGQLDNLDQLSEWATNHCVPLIREITFENGEALTEEGMPFLIMFHKPEDKESVKKYAAAIDRELMPEKGKVNFLTADGNQFSHPLHHLGKSGDDLPILCIDSFRHMYLFKNFNKNIDVPGKVKKFVEDLHSGKLHQDFHNPPEEEDDDEEPKHEDEEEHDEKPSSEEEGVQEIPPERRIDPNQEPSDDASGGEGTTGPPETIFNKLAPSENRYTLLNWRDYSGNYRDEL